MTKTIALIFSSILLLCSTITFGQTKSNCDTIFSHPEILPKNKRTDKELDDYKLKELVPIIARCSQSDSSEPIASLNMTLVIDKNGRIIDISIPTENISTQCKSELQNKMLTMTGWTSGKIKGKAICSRLKFSIICMKWEQQ
jgi:hypothetical protein